MQVRRIRAGEAGTLRQVRLRAVADSPEAFGEELEHAEGLPEATWAERAARGSEGLSPVTFFATDGDAITGMAAGHGDAGEVFLVGMWVAPEARRRGAGAALVAAVAGWARGLGADALLLHVADGNEPARSLYERCGFIDDGEVADSDRESSRCRRRMRLAL